MVLKFTQTFLIVAFSLSSRAQSSANVRVAPVQTASVQTRTDHQELIGTQVLDSSVMKKFPREVILKVYEVARNVTLSSAQQRALAVLFVRQDSTVADWLLRGRTLGEIDSMNAVTSQQVVHSLNKEQLKTYIYSRGSEFADIAATGELAYIKEEYHPDSILYNTIQRRTTGKYNFIYQNFLMQGLGKENAIKGVSTVSKLYDNYSYYTGLYSEKFVSDYLAKISAIENIPDTTLQKIRTMFSGLTQTNKYADWEKAIGEATQYWLPDTTLFSKLYHDDLEKKAFELSAADSYNLVYLQKISSHAYESVYGLIKEKNYTKALLEYTYFLYHHHLFDSLIRQTTHYYDSAVEASLIRDGSLQPTTQFAIGLKYKDLLDVSPGLADTLLQQAMFLSAKRDSILSTDPFALIDFGAYESAHLSQLLTEDQYNQLLSYKNRTLAMADARADWNEMELRGLSAGLDKEETTRQIANYYILKYGAWNRLAYDKIAQWATQRVISDSKPAALKILDPVRWNGDTTKTTNNLKLQW